MHVKRCCHMPETSQKQTAYCSRKLKVVRRLEDVDVKLDQREQKLFNEKLYLMMQSLTEV